MPSADRYWFDSFPGIDLNVVNPVLDFYGTPRGGPEHWNHRNPEKRALAFDEVPSSHAPYTTVSQNRGGPS